MSTEDRDAKIRELWPDHSVRQIAAIVGVSFQSVAKRGRKLGLEPHPYGQLKNTRLYLYGTCPCGAPLYARVKQDEGRKFCKKCLPTRSFGAKAYKLRELTGKPWLEIADTLAYRPGDPKRGDKLNARAAAWAKRNRRRWPVKYEKIAA